jgi:hypothetical protein
MFSMPREKRLLLFLMIYSFLFLISGLTGTFVFGLYGFLFNQISYLISPEYFAQAEIGNRTLAGIAGVKSTWWCGTVIGVIVIPSWFALNPGAINRLSKINIVRTVFYLLIYVIKISLYISVIILLYNLIKNINGLAGANIDGGAAEGIKLSAVEFMYNYYYTGLLIGSVLIMIKLVIRRFLI